MKKNINWNDLLVDSSRKCIDNARDVLLANPKEVDRLIELTFEGIDKISVRAIRTVNYAIQTDSKLFKKQVSELIWKFKDVTNESIQSHFIGIFYLAELPKKERDLVELTNICFEVLSRKVERIAMKVYAAETLYKIVQKYPDLKKELIEILKIHKNDEHLSLSTVSKRIIRDLTKLK